MQVSPAAYFLTSTGAMTWPRSWYVTQGRLVQLTVVGRRRTVRCWSYAYGLSGFYEIRAKLDSVVYALRITAVVLSLSLSRVFCLPVSLRSSTALVLLSGLRTNSSRLFRTRASSSGTRDLRCSCKPFPGVTLLTNVWAAAALFLQEPGLEGRVYRSNISGFSSRVRTVVAVPGVGAFIADTEASRTLTSEGNVTGSSSSTHSLSSPSLCRGTAPDPQEHSSLVFF